MNSCVWVAAFEPFIPDLRLRARLQPVRRRRAQLDTFGSVTVVSRTSASASPSASSVVVCGTFTSTLSPVGVARRVLFGLDLDRRRERQRVAAFEAQQLAAAATATRIRCDRKLPVRPRSPLPPTRSPVRLAGLRRTRWAASETAAAALRSSVGHGLPTCSGKRAAGDAFPAARAGCAADRPARPTASPGCSAAPRRLRGVLDVCHDAVVATVRTEVSITIGTLPITSNPNRAGSPCAGTRLNTGRSW